MSERIYSEKELPCYLSARDVAAYLGLGLTATYELLHEQSCPKIVRGRRIIVPRDPFLRWLEKIMVGEKGEK